MKYPNLVFVFPDQFRKQAIGCYNEDDVFTPNLDNLSSESLNVSNAFSNNPICSPYRAMLFSGKYQFNNGISMNCNSHTAKLGNGLKPNQTLLTDVLNQNGYNIGYIGKLHLDNPKESDYKYIAPKCGDGFYWDAYTKPENRHGVDFWYSYGCYDNHFKPHYWHDTIENRIDVKEWSVEHETKIAVDYILNTSGKRNEEKPFALFVAFNPPHMPFEQVPKNYKKLYAKKQIKLRPNVQRRFLLKKNIKNYFAAVSGVDENIGKILNAIEKKGIKNNTIFVFTSDHGEMLGSHGYIKRKDFWYNESVRVPFIIRYPGTIKSGNTNTYISAPDIFPTLLGLMGLSDKIPCEVEGKDLSQDLINKAASKKSVFYFHDNYRGIINDHFTYAVDLKTKKEYLFDNINDKYQLKNIADFSESDLIQMRKSLVEEMKNYGDDKYEETLKYFGIT